MITSQQMAQRIVAGIQAQPGEVIQIADRTGRADWLYELFLALERVGATPILDIEPPTFSRWLLTEATVDDVKRFGRHRVTSAQRADRMINLSSGFLDMTGAKAELLATWRGIVEEVTAIEESRRLPVLVVAIPTAAQAARLGLSLEALDAHLLPALALSAEETQQSIQAALATAQGGQHLGIFKE